ncbi:aminoglycoside phosphotransferase family protein [Natronolimnohabitans sp. A-GB9]|uniref:phosphotransferase family protein n=1 Tax=Natronolimnohabitans sp. A-GB9 TaxID=3069757 RepID=UPI0027B25F4E|nr:aminoglycoside phosphotransferase family protein [Natronolimnohabitans sp. A-GB9]MDQ2051833.1 aminoglycoside phosphotransferase family protein [Natronolimnohabitans sp. A-GB9]
MPTETAERIVERALEVGVRSCHRPRSGSVAETVVCRLTATDGNGDGNAAVGDRVVCKRGGASVWTGDVVEPLVCDLVGRTTDVPVPRVLATGTLEDGAELERWAVYEHRPGTNPRRRYVDLESPVRRRLVADAGTLLGRLHDTAKLAFDRVGGLARRTDGSGLVLCDPDGWHAVDPGPVLERLSVPLAGDDGCRPVLTHGDYQPGNLLVDESGAITAVLDWGNAHVTHAEYALARAEVRFVDVYAGRLPRAECRRLRHTFRRAYASYTSLGSGYDRRAPVYKLLWAGQSTANYLQIVRRARGRRQLRRQLCRVLE